MITTQYTPTCGIGIPGIVLAIETTLAKCCLPTNTPCTLGTGEITMLCYRKRLPRLIFPGIQTAFICWVSNCIRFIFHKEQHMRFSLKPDYCPLRRDKVGACGKKNVCKS